MRFGTEQTLFFVERWLTQPCRVLEVGCGDGELAAALLQRGHDVVAIDNDAASVRDARARGVDARLAAWPEFDDRPFDAVLFTRSLHHIEPLDGAVVRARELLTSSGALIVEDFAPYEMSPRFTSWLRGLVPEWKQDRVHPFVDMRRTIASQFTIVYYAEVPYCYRYVDDAEVRRVFDAELALGERPLGRRIVAT